MSLLTHSLIYQHDSAKLFARIAHEPWAMLLDSGQMVDPNTGNAGSQYGQYDILVAKPMATIVTKGEETTIQEFGVARHSEEDPLDLLNNLLIRYKAQALAAPFADLPFAGGAMGYFSYDLGRRIESIDDKNTPEDVAEMMVGIYDWAVVVDHVNKKTVLVSHGFAEETRLRWPLLVQLFDAPYKDTGAAFNVV